MHTVIHPFMYVCMAVIYLQVTMHWVWSADKANVHACTSHTSIFSIICHAYTTVAIVTDHSYLSCNTSAMRVRICHWCWITAENYVVMTIA